MQSLDPEAARNLRSLVVPPRHRRDCTGIVLENILILRWLGFPIRLSQERGTDATQQLQVHSCLKFSI